jgi:hypothetical protein
VFKRTVPTIDAKAAEMISPIIKGFILYLLCKNIPYTRPFKRAVKV